jgi:hypothetical protein
VRSSGWWEDFVSDTEPVSRHGSGAPSVNLVGLGAHDAPAIGELTALLHDVGIAVAAVVFPFVSPNAEREFASATLTVASPWEPVRSLLLEPLAARKHRLLEAPLPYGIRGTLRWVDQVCEALAVAMPTESLHQAWIDRYAKHCAELQRRIAARHLRVAVVFDRGSLSEILSPRVFFGLDLLELLSDAGFETLFVDWVPERARIPVEATTLERLGAQGAHYVRWETERSLAELGERYRLDLVYCDVNRGGFVEQQGFTPFGIHDLRPGLRGTEQTLRKLSQLARLQLFQHLSGANAVAVARAGADEASR